MNSQTGPPAGDHRVSDLTQDVRFAVTMSGGVSLAVWMGGVARELNLLQQASNARVNAARADRGAGPRQPPGPGPSRAGTQDWDGRCRELYQKLLQVLDVRVTVDVLSGTSAGGINAALLGLSSAAGVDLAGLRNLWFTTGSMDAMLRDPGEKNPPSLMQGDKVLFAGLEQGITSLCDNGRPEASLRPPDQAPKTTVFITTTMMSGETSRFTDDYGTLVPDVDNHGLFTFGQEALAPENGKPSLGALALAARCSASFPAAFEPSFVPIHGHVGAAGGIPARPDMAGFANMTRSHWTADGGLLANRPLTPLLDQVFAQPAQGQVRRVLAFVVPDGGGTSRPAAVPEPDTWGRPPTMAGAIKEDLGAQLSQSIAADLQAVRSHNDRLKGRYQLRRYLADMGALLPAGHGLVTGRLLRDYEQEQGAGLAQPVLDQLMRELSTMPLPAAWVSELAEDAEPPEQRLAAEMVRILGTGWRPAADGAAGGLPANGGRPSDGGRPADGGRPEGGERAAAASWQAAADPFDRAAAFGLPVFHAARATAIHLVRLGYQGATESSQREALASHRAQLEAAYPAPAADGDQPTDVAGQLAGAAGGRPVPDLMTVARQLAGAERQRLLIGPAAPGSPVRAAWIKLAAAMGPLLTELNGLASPATSTSPDGRPSRQAATAALQSYLGYLGAATEPEELADRLLSLVIAERALEPAQPGVDQPVEFVQVSANTRTLLAPPGQLGTVSKLRGVEMHHFAAFYQSSWRAWDWMWGRLDGSGWLVHILLDPRRILAVVENSGNWGTGTRADRFAGLLRDTLGLPAGLDGDCLAADLRFLDQPEAPIPVSLPNSALFLAQAWQDLIAANELPAIAQQMNADAGHPLTNGWASDVLTMQQKDKPPAEFARKLALCPVRGESLAGDLRTAAFAKMATKAAAVATAAVSSAPEVPGAVRPVLASARSVTRTGYLAAKATGGSGWRMLLLGLVLTVIGGVLATQGMLVVGVTGTVIALAGLYLIAMGAWGIHRGLLSALAAITVLALAGSLTLAWVRAKVWGTAQKGSNGLVPAHVLPWLRSSWWGSLALIGGILALASLISVLTRRRPRRNRGAPRVQPPRPPGPPGPPGPGTGAVPVEVSHPGPVTAGPAESPLTPR